MYDDDYDYAYDAIIEEHLRMLSEDPVIDYLGRYGDAIQERVETCADEARGLLEAGFPGAAVVRATAAIELVIRFFLARPLVQGAFLSEEWAGLLAERILRGRSADDRELLPAILNNWGIDLRAIRLPDGSSLWECVVSRVWPRRNEYVHRGSALTREDAAVAIESLQLLVSEVVEKVAERFGFTRAETGRWSIRLSEHDRSLNPPHVFECESPFGA